MFYVKQTQFLQQFLHFKKLHFPNVFLPPTVQETEMWILPDFGFIIEAAPDEE